MDNEITHSFIDKYNEGEVFEEYILNDIKSKKYPQAYRFKSNNKDENKWYDIIIPELSQNEIIGIECKNDISGGETSNICIEVGQDGTESGIKVTLAKYWIHSDTKFIYIASVDVIKNLIKSSYCDEIRKMKKDKGYVPQLNGIKFLEKFPEKQDGYFKYMDLFLIPKKIFIQHCLEVGTYDNIKYDKLL